MKLPSQDPEIFEAIKHERRRQKYGLELIPSENYTSPAVMEAVGSVLTNKYSEGYPHKRYYGGNLYIDRIERIAQKRACELFDMPYANVQPYSGSPANHAVYMGLVVPGDRIMGMGLAGGGHLTHGQKANFSAHYYESHPYEVDPESGLLDYDAVRARALSIRPKLIWAGATAYPRIFDFPKFREIADEVGAYLACDVAHYAGLIAGRVYPSPAPYAHVVTMTSHKTLRGPRGALILSAKENVKDTRTLKDGSHLTIAQAIDRAVFPGLQGGPHDHVTAGIAVALKQAASASFAQYAQQVLLNAQTVADDLLSYGYDLVTGGTDNHLILIDLTKTGITGAQAQDALEAAGMTVNKNTVPKETRSAFNPSGIRIGTPALTTRGMKQREMRQVAAWMHEVLSSHDNKKVIKRVRGEIHTFCRAYPVPGIG